MSKVRAEAEPREAVCSGAILVIDKDRQTGATVSDRISSNFGDAYEVAEASDGEEAILLIKSLRQDKGLDIPVIVMNLTLELSSDASHSEGLISKIRDEVPSATRIIVYTDKPLAQVRKLVTDVGASTCVNAADVEAAIHGVFLEDELGGLDDSKPAVAGVVNTVNVGISIQNHQMEVLWANDRIMSHVDDVDKERRICWEKYHKFYHRKCGCLFSHGGNSAGCTGRRVLELAAEQIKNGTPIHNGVSTGYHLLPFKGKLARVEVDAAPLMSRDGRKVLAVIEAIRLVTKEWEESNAAHNCIREVMSAARDLGREQEDALPFAAIAVYYQPDDHEELFLFDAVAENAGMVPELLRLRECPDAYRDALASLQPQFFIGKVATQPRQHFLWAGRSSIGTNVIIDVLYTDDKPRGLLDQDLRPYWQYIIDHFDVGKEIRESVFQQTADSALQEFLEATANGIRDDAGLERAIAAARHCIEATIQPVSMYIRILDRSRHTLVKREGYGPYSEMAPENRQLQYDGVGSSGVVSTRQAILGEHVDTSDFRRCMGRDLKPIEMLEVGRISGYAVLPLLWMGRALGTLSIHFTDDSMFSKAKRRFVQAVANSLGGVLGSLQWAHERTALVKYSKDLDGIMFRRSEHPEDEETELLAQVTRMVFELTAAEVVAYYRYDAQNRNLTLIGDATQGNLPSEMALPESLPPDVGIASRAAANRRSYLVHDYLGDEWAGIRNRLISVFPTGPENEFCRWVGAEIAEPVIGGHMVVGTLVAMSSIPGWLNSDDAEVIREFAFKTGVCLEAKLLARKLNWHLRTKIALNDITAAMARVSDLRTLYRLYLLAITADECLGFSRAVLFLNHDGEEQRFVAMEAVGAQTLDAARARWQEAGAMILAEKMDACAQPVQSRPGDLRETVLQTVFDLNDYSDLAKAFKEQQMVVRRRLQPHPIGEDWLRSTLCMKGSSEGEYVLAPLTINGETLGFVLADRAFLDPIDIPADRLDLLQLLTSEFSLMLESIKLRREEQESKTEMEVARGVSYSLRTRAAALEARISLFAHNLGDTHEDAIAGLKRSVKFFGRAGTLASKLLRLKDIGVGKGEPIDLNSVLAEMVDAVSDPRVVLKRADSALWIQAERHYMDDLFLEVLWNACEFTAPDRGAIRMMLSREGEMAKVECIDNGQGVQPDLRQDLFKPFKCYPATRMGLGLSYVARLAEAYGGTVEEIGSWGKGAHFVVRIPLTERD